MALGGPLINQSIKSRVFIWLYHNTNYCNLALICHRDAFTKTLKIWMLIFTKSFRKYSPVCIFFKLLTSRVWFSNFLSELPKIFKSKGLKQWNVSPNGHITLKSEIWTLLKFHSFLVISSLGPLLKFSFSKRNFCHPRDLVDFVASVKLFVVIKFIIWLKQSSFSLNF